MTDPHTHWKRSPKLSLLLLATTLLAWGQTPSPQTPASNSPPSIASDPGADPNSCRVFRVTTLPGSHHFASDFLTTIATDSDPKTKDQQTIWGLNADLAEETPPQDRAMYISKSTDGGRTWTQLARIDSRYFDAEIGEGLRNGLSVSPGGTDFVITTQLGAFQVFPQSGISEAVVKSIPGPRVPHPLTWLYLPKAEGDPIKGDVVLMAADGRHMIVGYGYFDLNPQLITYRKSNGSSWVKDGTLPHLPTEMDIFSMQWNEAKPWNDLKKARPTSIYVGTGDQAFRLNLLTKKWTRVTGVGPDSAIHGMSLVGGPHLAACWGIYNPLNPDAVKRITDARFLLHRFSDEVGPEIRAYGIEVDPSRPDRQVVTSITGVYTSDDNGATWRRMNDLPEGEYRSAHFNPDGSVLVSGIPGTFLSDPFSTACSPRLKTRDQ